MGFYFLGLSIGFLGYVGFLYSVSVGRFLLSTGLCLKSSSRMFLLIFKFSS